MAKVWIFSLLSYSHCISIPALREGDKTGRKKREAELGKWRRKILQKGQIIKYVR
jgi:hypothetical protein